MRRLLMSTAIVGLAALPGFAIAQSDQTDSNVEAETGAAAGAETEAGSASGGDTEAGARSETETGSDTETEATPQPGSDDSESGAATGGSTEGGAGGGSDGEMSGGGSGDASDAGSGGGPDAGSGDEMSGGAAEVTEGHSQVDPAEVEASELQGAPVLSREGDEIADVSEVLLTGDGSIEAIVVNVGGILGIGSKPVAAPFDRVTLQTNEENGDLSVIMSMSRQELEDLPRYEDG